MRGFDNRSIAPIIVDDRGNARSAKSSRPCRHLVATDRLNARAMLSSLGEASSYSAVAAYGALPSERGAEPYGSYFPNELRHRAITSYLVSIYSRCCRPQAT